jgi:tRNA-specific 2-thiouridylase
VWHGQGDERVDAVVRYRMAPAPAAARISNGSLNAVFDTPLLGVAPGQALVCYRGDVVIGGGVISCAS